MKETMKDTIILEVKKNIKSSTPVDKLNVKSIESNILLIVKYIENDATLHKVFSKEKEIWLIKMRLGLLGEAMTFEDMSTKLTDIIKKTFLLGALHEVEYEEALRKKFTIYIRKINNVILKEELHIQRDVVKSYQIKNRKLREERDELLEDNIDLLDALELQEQQALEFFSENVLLKVKKYLDK